MNEQYHTSSIYDLIMEREYRFAEFLRAARLIVEHPSILQCKATRQIVDVPWYERVYFLAQRNMMLVRNSTLPEGLLGIVLRKNLEWKGQSRGLFLVKTAKLKDVVAEQFVIAHEIGHILLHGRLMQPGMVLKESDSSYRAQDDERRQLAELEANIYALLSVIPAGAIGALDDVLGRPVYAAELAEAMSRVTERHFGVQLAKERLVLHHVLRGECSADEFYATILLEERSWTRHGAAGMLERQAARVTQAKTLPDELFERWKRKLLERDILELPRHAARSATPLLRQDSATHD